ncbi:hypothetical protein ABET51_06815 [Metabacillus fastidiosus]|uniref:hypothetical protein n=1 Tax=Metabacillus fastidiosus TaxID=1458 RepID=UPI003D2A69FF
MASHWTKGELEILENHFVNLEWEKFLEMLPKKTEKQILSRAKKLGLKKEDDLIGRYYDDEEGGWVEKTRSFLGDRVMTMSVLYPCKKGTTFEFVHQAFSDHVSQVYYETIFKKKCIDFISEYNLEPHEDIINAFFEFSKKTFSSNVSKAELDDASKELAEVVTMVYTEKKDEIEALKKERIGSKKKRK